MNPASNLRYFVREAARDLWDRRSVTILSMATIAASLYLVGLFLVASRGIGSFLARWTDELSVSIFLGDEASEAEIETIRRRITASGDVRSFDFVNRAAALERFKSDFPDLADLPGVLEGNPFPASFEVRLRPESGSAEQVGRFAAAFTGLPGVEDVRWDARWLSRLRSLLRMAGFGGLLLGGVLLTAAVLTISSVIRMGIYERRDEIEVLRLVGANPGFIRAPFLIEGAMQGLAGGLAAVAGITATWLLLRGSAGMLSAPLLGEVFGPFVRPLDAAFLLVGGGLLGLSGSMVAGVRE